jgi:hypothetical protein
LAVVFGCPYWETGACWSETDACWSVVSPAAAERTGIGVASAASARPGVHCTHAPHMHHTLLTHAPHMHHTLLTHAPHMHHTLLTLHHSCTVHAPHMHHLITCTIHLNDVHCTCRGTHPPAQSSSMTHLISPVESSSRWQRGRWSMPVPCGARQYNEAVPTGRVPYSSTHWTCTIQQYPLDVYHTAVPTGRVRHSAVSTECVPHSSNH